MIKNKLKKSLRKDEGFTLAELLIVVAIIAVLAIIAIPIFSSKIENSREETDIANIRSAKAAAVAQYLTGTDLDNAPITSEGFTCYFDAAAGKLVGAKTGISGYGRGTESRGGCEDVNMIINPEPGTEIKYYTETTNVNGYVIQVEFNDSGQIILSWVS